MKFINGTEQILYIKVEGVYFPIGCLTENSFSETAEMIDTTVRTNKNGWTSSRPTNQSYSISFSGLVLLEYLQAGTVTYHDLKRIKRTRLLIEWKTDGGINNPEFGFGYITHLGDTAAIDNFISFNGSITGWGEPSNAFDEIYFGYKDRVEADGGTLTSEQCTIKYIEKILNN